MNKPILKETGERTMPIKLGGMTLYTIQELAKTLEVTPLTLRAYVRLGRLRAQKVGRKWLISEESLREYLNPPSKEDAKGTPSTTANKELQKSKKRKEN